LGLAREAPNAGLQQSGVEFPPSRIAVEEHQPPPHARRWVVLRHDLPDGSWHYDWMLQVCDDPAEPLLTFRVMVRPDDPTVVAFEGERLPDHRSIYLDYEGPISGGRGSVTRIARGTLRRSDLADGDGRCTIDMMSDRTGSPHEFNASRIEPATSSDGSRRPLGDPRWRFTRVSAHARA
jgi:hypothetical protein